MASRNRKLVPACDPVLQQWKYEVAGELGIALPGVQGAGFDAEMAGELGNIGGIAGRPDDWGSMTARQTGSIGGQITRRLVRRSEQGMNHTIRP